MARIKKGVPWIDTRDGVYYACWYDDAERRTKRFSLRTRDSGEAQGRFAAWLAEEGPRIAGKPLIALTVSAVLQFYEDEHVEPNVSDKYRLRVDMRHLRAFFGDWVVTDLDIPSSRKYAAKRMLEDGAAPGTVNKEIRTLLAAIRHNIKWKRLTLADEPKLEKPSAPRSRGIWLTREEWARLRAAAEALRADGTEASKRAHAYLEIAYHTAARRGVVETLQWFQIDLVRGRINFSHPGGQETNKRRVVVPIDPAILPLMRAMKTEAKTSHVFGEDFSARYALERVARKAGLLTLGENDSRPAGKLSPHILRHTRATHLLQAGKKPWAVATLLGDTVQTVLRVYGHHCPDYLDELFETDELARDVGA